MTATDDITPGERRELRSVVKGQFKVLRSEVTRRKDELKGEIESALLRQYRDQDQAIHQAHEAQQRALNDYVLAVEQVARDLRDVRPELTVEVGNRYGEIVLKAADPNRGQAHAAAIANIPSQVGDAMLRLDRQEQDILRDLSVGALKSDQAQGFLSAIPTVGELVPRAVLREIEAEISGQVSP